MKLKLLCGANILNRETATFNGLELAELNLFDKFASNLNRPNFGYSETLVSKLEAMKQIVRNNYMNTLIGLRDKNLIKVLTGVRRCGKSTVMQMFRDYLLADNVDENQIVFMNFEALENHKWLTDFEGLYYHIINQLDISKPCYVFLDEVQ